jgi:putative membrane protein
LVMGSIGSVEILILSILPVVVMFVLLYLVIKWAVSSALRSVSSAFREGLREGLARDHTAREILDERYARGEMGREEYEQMRRDIRAE